MSTKFCTACGQQAVVANAPACGRCGRPFPAASPAPVEHSAIAVDALPPLLDEPTSLRMTPVVEPPPTVLPAPVLGSTSPPVPPPPLAPILTAPAGTAGLGPTAWVALGLICASLLWCVVALISLQIKVFENGGYFFGSELAGLAYLEAAVLWVLAVALLLAAAGGLLLLRSPYARPMVFAVAGLLAVHGLVAAVGGLVRDEWFRRLEYGGAGIGYGNLPPWWLVFLTVGIIAAMVLVPGAVTPSEPVDASDGVLVAGRTLNVASMLALFSATVLALTALSTAFAVVVGGYGEESLAIVALILVVVALLAWTGFSRARGPVLVAAPALMFVTGVAGAFWSGEFVVGSLGDAILFTGLAALPIALDPRAVLPTRPAAPVPPDPAVSYAPPPATYAAAVPGAPVKVDSKDPRLTSSWPTVLTTFLFGLAGIAAAMIQSNNAKKRGLETNRYWKAFLITQITGFLLWVAFWVGIIVWLNSMSSDLTYY